jgi:hypothetical protein
MSERDSASVRKRKERPGLRKRSCSDCKNWTPRRKQDSKDRKPKLRESKRTPRKENKTDSSDWQNKKSSGLSVPQKKENARS